MPSGRPCSVILWASSAAGTRGLPCHSPPAPRKVPSTKRGPKLWPTLKSPTTTLRGSVMTLSAVPFVQMSVTEWSADEGLKEAARSRPVRGAPGRTHQSPVRAKVQTSSSPSEKPRGTWTTEK
ncbi:hypothetical protein M885DRAFT_527943 [Pelagophyceae sp. CCMP2097]|nr:hypothetical protein M885DRAFT_527943 [Pelagophyceae sp. CCMP2097]